MGSSWHNCAGGHLSGVNGPGGQAWAFRVAPGSMARLADPKPGAIPLLRSKSFGTYHDCF